MRERESASEVGGQGSEGSEGSGSTWVGSVCVAGQQPWGWAAGLLTFYTYLLCLPRLTLGLPRAY
jgi:hypothetical protein